MIPLTLLLRIENNFSHTSLLEFTDLGSTQLVFFVYTSILLCYSQSHESGDVLAMSLQYSRSRGAMFTRTVYVEPRGVFGVAERVGGAARVAAAVGRDRRADVECGHHVAIERRLLADGEAVLRALLQRLRVQQPGEARRRRGRRGAAQRHAATRPQRLLDESVVQLRR